MLKLRLFGLVAAGALVLSVGCGGGGEEAASEPAAEETAAVETFTVDPATAASVSGKVSFEGEAPRAVRINMSAEPDCHDLHSEPPTASPVDVTDGSLANVFVWVKSGLEGKKFETSSDVVKLDQKGCLYTPRVVAVQTGQTLSVSNDDPTTHNIHPLPKINREFNKSQSPGASAIDATFPRQEIMIAVKCNIHPWMKAYINVVDHPFFAVTGADGTFELKGLPPGEYTIEAVHETLGNKEMKVTLGDSASETADFSYAG